MKLAHSRQLMALLSLAVVTMLACAPARAADPAVQRFTLDNGLRVILRPTATAQQTALVVLFDIGERHDPPGRSGMGHLIEHLYCTAATADAPNRTVDQFFARYGGQANAQAGWDYTIIAGVFPNDRLHEELVDAAARMRELRLEQADLDRERPRIDIELQNMYRRVPHLAAMNLARQAAVPMQAGARKGGVQEQIAPVTIAEAQDRHRRYYKPRHARLVVVGGFAAEPAIESIVKLFADIASGEAAPEPAPTLPSDLPNLHQLEATDAMLMPGGSRAAAALAFAAPSPTDELYPAFLYLHARLLMKLLDKPVRAGRVSPLAFAPLDDPTAIFLCGDVEADVTDDDAVKGLRERMQSIIRLGVDEKPQSQVVLFGTGALLGLIDQPDDAIAMNPYGTAFMLGRLDQLGVNPNDLAARLKLLTREQVDRCAKEYFGTDHGAAAVVRAK